MTGIFPYDGTSGWSGTDTSRERAVSDDSSGRTSARLNMTVQALAGVGSQGMTWKELSDVTGWHHGQASGALTVLHKNGRVVRLLEKRNRCRVYVLPDFVDGRESDLPAVRMSQEKMRAHLLWSHQHATVWGDSRLEEQTGHLLNLYWPNWREG